MDVVMKMDRLSLGNLGEGAATEAFEKEVAAWLGRLREHEAGVNDGGVYVTEKNVLTGEITLKVKFAHSMETGATSYAWDISTKFPARKGTSHQVMARDNELLVQNHDIQEPLLRGKAHPHVVPNAKE